MRVSLPLVLFLAAAAHAAPSPFIAEDLHIMPAVAGASAAPPPPLPAHCVGDTCRRSKCGDVCNTTDCSHFGNVCAGGASAPVAPGWTYASSFEAPPYPVNFTPDNATIFCTCVFLRGRVLLCYGCRGRVCSILCVVYRR